MPPSTVPQPTLDFSDRDFDSIKLRLQGLIRSTFPDWTDFNVASFGNILLELFAYVGDGLHFYIDAAARNAFWPTVENRVQAIRIGRIFDFRLTGAAAATSPVDFTLPSTTSVGVTIPAGTRLRTKNPENPIPFRTTAELIIAIGQSAVSGSAEQAEPRSDIFNSNGAPNQEFTLTQVPFLDGSGSATFADGVYTEVTSFLGAEATDRVFVILVDQFDQARIRFGNGANGSIPQGTGTVNYKTGGGLAGNVEANQITIIEDVIPDGGGNPAPLSVNNPLPATAGLDRQTIEQARALAPAGLRTLTRTVTKDDFENGALSVAGVARALMATSNESAAIQENEGTLFVVAQGAELASGRIVPGTPSQALLDAVLVAVVTTKPHTLTFLPTAAAATFTTINVSTRIFLALGASSVAVAAAVLENLRDFFAVLLEDGTLNPAVDFGANIKDNAGTIVAEVAWSDVFNAIRDTTGVRAVDPGPVGLLLNSLRDDVAVGALKFPLLGTVAIIDADTGSTLLTA